MAEIAKKIKLVVLRVVCMKVQSFVSRFPLIRRDPSKFVWDPYFKNEGVSGTDPS